MVDRSKNILQRETIAEFVRLLTGSSDAIMCWRFLPEEPNEKVRVLAHEKAERECRRKAGDADWNAHCVRRNYNGTLDEVWPALEAHQAKGWGIFVVINEGGRNAKSITRVRALFIDQDSKSLDATEWHLTPDFICQRSETRWHAYWQIDDCSVAQFTETQKRLAQFYGSDPDVSDASRIMRVPGTIHQKRLNSEAAALVKLIGTREEWDNRHSYADVTHGLPDLPPQDEKAVGPATGEPVSDETLRQVLGYLDAENRYAEWRDIVAAIRATPLVNDADESKRRALAHAFSEGKLDRNNRFEDTLPSNYDGPDAVDAVFDSMPPKKDGVGFGTLVHHAKQNGMQWGEPEPFTRYASETFSEYIEKTEADEGDNTFPVFEPWQFKDRPAPRWIIDQIVREKAIHVNFGKSESVKTFFALDLLGSVATGIRAFGKFEVFLTGDVVFFCDEDPDDVMTVRWPAWCKARGIDDPYSDPFAKTGHLAIIPRCPLVSNPAEVENAIKRIRDKGFHPKLIAIDTAAKAMGGMDQDNARDAGILIAAMTRFRREFGCATWLTHHPKKSDPSDMRGSGALTNDVDIVWQSIRSGQTLAVKLQCMKMKSAPKPSPLHFQGTLYAVDGVFDQNGQQVTAPAFDYVAASLDREPLTPLKAEQQALREQVLTALREGDKINALPLAVRSVAEHINPRQSMESVEDWERRIANDVRKIQRHVGGARGKLGGLSDLVELDTRGQPISPFRFILPDRYRVADAEAGL